MSLGNCMADLGPRCDVLGRERETKKAGGRTGAGLWLAMCLLQIAIFEVEAYLKWLPPQSKLKSGTFITKIKTECQGLHYTRQCKFSFIGFWILL